LQAELAWMKMAKGGRHRQKDAKDQLNNLLCANGQKLKMNCKL
jgi:hypothetical protein